MLRKRPAPPLLLSIALLLSSMLASSSSQQRNATRHGSRSPSFSLDDYDVYEDSTVSTRTTPGSPPPLCQYDLCKDQQESCQKLALTLYCSCPGISGPFDPPDPPSLQSLSLENKGTVVVRWCAPSSTVTYYLVQVGGQDEAHKVSANRRMMELGDIAPGTEVCVEAVNSAGVSTRGSHSCKHFESSNSSETRLAIKLVLIGAAVVLAVGIVLALVLWWCRRHRKAVTRTANRGTDVVL